jgi:predicted amidohydrolase YtcJ
MILTGARVHVLDPAGTVADTLVLRGGRVAFAGARRAVNPAAGEPVLDLGGRTVLPGLTDAHGHLMLLARQRLGVEVGGAGDEEAAARRLAGAGGRPPGEWITGRGWDQTRWPGGAFPTRAALDRVAPRHPVALARVDGHALWVNSAALRLAGVERGTRDPAGGRILRGPDGEPSGVLVDAAQDLVLRAVPPPAPERFEAAVEAAIGECLARGLTGVHEMGVDAQALAAYRRLLAQARFPFRVYAAVAGGDPAWPEARERGPERPAGGRLVVGAVKLFADGALGSRGAALHAPYSDDPGNRGLLLLPPDELRARIDEAVARGFQVCVHAIGDLANTLALDAFAAVLRARPAAAATRPRIEHAQVLDPSDIPRFGALGVLASVQPTHCVSDMPWAPARLGPARLAGAYAWRALRAAGARLAGGSDFPVEDPSPFLGLHAAVTRRPPGGAGPGWQPEQRLTREEAVRAFTTWNAWASHREGELGSLEPGRRADLVVLSDDPLACPEASLPAIVPVLTLVDGEVVYRGPGAPA